MAYTVERIPDEPIIVCTFDGEFTVAKHLASNVKDIIGAADEISGNFFYIANTTNLKMAFADMLNGMGAITKGRLAIFSDPRLNLVVVGAKGVLDLGARALEQIQYGGMAVQRFDTVDEAVAYAREQIAAGALD